MNTSMSSSLEDAIRKAGEGWVIDYFAPPSKALDHLRRVLRETQERAKERLRGNAPDLSESAIVAEFQQHPSQVKGFFQALGGTNSPEMLLMTWRIIQGMNVKDIQLVYRRKEAFTLRVVLESPYGVEDTPYESNNINDFALLRHMGILEIDGRPVFDGFYPLRIRGK